MGLHLRVAVVAVLGLALQGCYYLQLAGGQLQILERRVPIAEALEYDHLSDTERDKLTLVEPVLSFARGRVQLTSAGSYETFYDTGLGPVSWNVVACEKTRFQRHEFWFPVIGEAPYKGYFHREGAQGEVASLEARGLDVRLVGVPAYSTLGWFEDPVYRSMLRASQYGFVSTLIHEVTHSTIFRPGDATFNESMATFVGQAGAMEFLREHFGPGSCEVHRAEAELHDRALFRQAMHEFAGRLEALYESEATEEEKLTLREAIFADGKARFEALRVARFRTEGYAWIKDARLDNCFFMSHRTYTDRVAIFARVHEATGERWADTLAVFAQAAAAEDPTLSLEGWLAHRAP
ncbi:MAG: aminopeptidase [Planctomycetota bacterium]